MILIEFNENLCDIKKLIQNLIFFDENFNCKETYIKKHWEKIVYEDT